MRRATIVSLLLLAGACSRAGGGDVRRFPLAGAVVGHEASPPRVVVAHEAVAGLMPAMTMAFEVAGEAPATRVGDRIAATLAVSGDRSWLEHLRITAAARGPAAAPRLSRAAPGAMVPPFRLLDQDGRVVTNDTFAGRVLLMTFIYTRCPLPDFCPLMVRNLETVRRGAEEEGLGARLALLAITLDPAFDTPAVLRQYGESVLKGSDRFSRWTLAGGEASEIEALAAFFGVAFRGEGGLITHTLATAVVSPDGRVTRLLVSNAWRPADALPAVRSAAARASAK